MGYWVAPWNPSPYYTSVSVSFLFLKGFVMRALIALVLVGLCVSFSYADPEIVVPTVTDKGATYITNVNDVGKVWVKLKPKGVNGVEFHLYEYKNGNKGAKEVPHANGKCYKVTNALTLEVEWYLFADTLDVDGMTVQGGNWGIQGGDRARITEFYESSTGWVNPDFAGPGTIYWLEYFVDIYDLELVDGCP